MPRTGLAYEKPSRIAQGLVVCFSIAVVVMAGWLVMMIMFSYDANTMVAGEADIQTSAQPFVESISPGPTRLSSTVRSSSAYPEPWEFRAVFRGAARSASIGPSAGVTCRTPCGRHAQPHIHHIINRGWGAGRQPSRYSGR